MHRRLRVILMLAVAALATDQARADMSLPRGILAWPAASAPATLDGVGQDDATIRSSSKPRQAGSVALADDTRKTRFSALDDPTAPTTDADLLLDQQSTAAADQPVYRLPPAPSSTRLFLSAFASLGAWHVFRSAKDLKLTNVPAWYHTDAPAQIGQAVPFDFQHFALPLTFPEPATRRIASHRVPTEPTDDPVRSAHLLLPECRGPPQFVSSR